MTTRRQREHLKTQLIETDRLLGMVSGDPFMSASLSARRKEVEERLESLPVGEVESMTVLNPSKDGGDVLETRFMGARFRDEIRALLKDETLPRFFFFFLALLVPSEGLATDPPQQRGEGKNAGIGPIWLTPLSGEPPRVCVSWISGDPGPSRVEFGVGPELDRVAQVEGRRNLHQVEIDLPGIESAWSYRVATGEALSGVYSFHFPGGEEALRMAVVANLGDGRGGWGRAILAERPHLLLTAGDNVTDLHPPGQSVDPGDFSAFARLVSTHPDLFRSTLFLPVLGNHDKAFRPRGAQPPEEPVYDVEATAFRKFFRLPGEGWVWHFDVPGFGLRLAALDMHHLSDMGTTWQSSQPVAVGSEQFEWYARIAGERELPFFVTLYNERHGSVRRLADGAWWSLIRRGSLAVTGFGHYGERIDDEGFPAYDISVRGTGTPYPDARSAVLHSVDNYLLLTLERGGPLVGELRDFERRTLPETRIEIPPRPMETP